MANLLQARGTRSLLVVARLSTERMTPAVYGRVTIDDRLTAASAVFSQAIGQSGQMAPIWHPFS